MSDFTNPLRTRALVTLFVGAAAIALAPIFVRVSEIGPVETAFYRMFLSLPVLAVWVGLDTRRPHAVRKTLQRRDIVLLVLAGVFFTGDLALWHWSIRLTTIANATLFANFAPIFVTLGSFFLFGQRFSRTFLFGLVLAIVGVATLVGVSAGTSRTFLIGDALGIGTAVFYAAYIMTISRLRAGGLATSVIMLWSGVAAALSLFPLALLAGGPLIPPTLAGWAILVGLAIISHAGGQSLIAYALAHLPAAFSSVGLLVQPVIATMIAWGLFAEAVTGLRAVGIGVVLAGIFFAHRGSFKGAKSIAT